MLEAKEALQKVKSGSFSLIDHKNYIQVLVASYYTDSKGYTPFYISDKGITVIAVFGWGVRQVFSNAINICNVCKGNIKYLVSKRIICNDVNFHIVQYCVLTYTVQLCILT